MARLLICAGGTGGGVYPALSVLQAAETETESVLWVGGQGGMEADLVQRAGVPFEAIPAAGLHGVGLKALPSNLVKLVRGTFASSRILHEFKPDVLFFTGGYIAAPMAVAGRKTPTLLYVPDIEPGMALNFLARFATKIAVTAEDSVQYFKDPSKVVVTGYPTRPELSGWTKATARQMLNLNDELPVLLVFGGSKGARSINRAVLAVLPELLETTQVVHISGQLDWDETLARHDTLPRKLLARYHAYPYLHEEMGAALAAADLVISRAGASTLGEFPLFGLPAILVPYPFAWRYQKVNADYLVNHNAAIMVENDALPERLLPTLRELLADSTRLEGMSRAMRSLARPYAAVRIADLITELGGSPNRKEGSAA